MPLIEGIPEPKFGDSEKRKQDNLEFNKPLNKPLDETKDELKGFFGDFNNSSENHKKEENFIDADNLVNPELNISEEEVTEKLLNKDASKPIEYDEKGNILDAEPKKEIDIEDKVVKGGNDNVPGFTGNISDIEGINNKSLEKQYLGELDNSPLLPVIDGLLDSKSIDIEQYNTIIEKLVNSDKNEYNNIVENFISELNIDNKEGLLKNIKGEEVVTKENFEESDFYKTINNVDTGGSKPEGNSLDLLLASNFVKLPNTTTKDNLMITMDITLNKLIKKNSSDFLKQNSKLINSIKDGKDIISKYMGLKELNHNSLLKDAGESSKQSKAFKKGQESIKNKEISKEEKVIEYKKVVKESIENKDIIKLQEIKEELDNFKEELPKGDTIESSVMDLISEVKESILEQD